MIKIPNQKRVFLLVIGLYSEQLSYGAKWHFSVKLDEIDVIWKITWNWFQSVGANFSYKFSVQAFVLSKWVIGNRNIHIFVKKCEHHRLEITDFTWNQSWEIWESQNLLFYTFCGSEFWYLCIFVLFEGWNWPNYPNLQKW